MATRAPKSAARPRNGASRPRQASGASRTGSASRSRAGRGAASPYRRSSGRPAASGRGASRRTGSGRTRTGRRPPPPANPLIILLGWIVSAIGGIWMTLAHTVGTVARTFGRSARDLDPVHRRDGLGLLALCAAFVSAAAIWWHLGLIGKPLTAVMLGLFGSAAWTVPILLGLLAVRFL